MGSFLVVGFVLFALSFFNFGYLVGSSTRGFSRIKIRKWSFFGGAKLYFFMSSVYFFASLYLCGPGKMPIP